MARRRNRSEHNSRNQQALVTQQGRSESNGGSTYTFVTLPMQLSFSTNSMSIPPLPLKLDSDMFHIEVILGKLNAPRGESVSIKAGCDSLSAGNFGNMKVLLNLIRCHPTILKEITFAKPGVWQDILLGGIV